MLKSFIKALLDGGNNQVHSKVFATIIGLLCFVALICASIFTKRPIPAYVYWSTVSVVLGAAGISEVPGLLDKFNRKE